MTKLALALALVLVCFALPDEAHADSKAKGKAKAESKVVTSARAPVAPPASVSPAPTATTPARLPGSPSSPLPADGAVVGSGLNTPETAGTITTEEARALVTADVTAAANRGDPAASGVAGSVSVDPAPQVDPLSLIQPVRRAHPTRVAPSAAQPSLEQPPASLFPIGSATLAAVLAASLGAVALTLYTLRRAGRLVPVLVHR